MASIIGGCVDRACPVVLVCGGWIDGRTSRGEVRYVQGSAAKPYKLMCKGGVYSCDCPRWRNFGGPIDNRTCKHLRAENGSAFEDARLHKFGGTSGAATPVVSKAPTPSLVAPVGVGAADPSELGEESPEDVIAEVFGKKKITRLEVITTPEGAKRLQGMTEVAGLKALSVEPAEDPKAAYKQSLIDRAAAEGRSLRQDEKAKINGPPILLAHKWDGELDPTGHFLSEKRDGVRAYWNGTDFISRQGNVYTAPSWFKAGLPDHPLDGELIIGRKQFPETISVVKSIDSGDQWKKVRFEVFDAPNYPGTFEERIAYCRQILQGAPFASVLDQVICTGIAHLRQELARIEALGGEGVMIRKAGSQYEVGRSYSLLKVKSFFDCEATVTGHLPGKGKHKGVLGSLECKLPSGISFSVGSGLSDAIRRSPPQVGSIITVRYQELSKDGVPRFPTFVSVRDYE